MKLKLDSTHPEYDANKKRWKLVRDVVSGEQTLKDNDLKNMLSYSGQKSNILGLITQCNLYLPFVDTDCTTQALIKQANYIQRAALFNFTKRTLTGLLGMVFSKPSVIELPKKIEYLIKTSDGSEIGLLQQVQEVLTDVLETGRDGLLADFPSVESPVTEAEAEINAIRTSIVVYKAESILDWGYEKVGSASVLSYVKLLECDLERDDETMEVEEEEKYRCLHLIDGEYVVRIYKKKEYETTGVYEEYIPKNGKGASLNYIPFYFVGAENNKPSCDIAPLLDIANVNIHHYRDSADWQDSSFTVGQPTLCISGLDGGWVETYLKDGVKMGSSVALLLPQGADGKMLQADPNTMPLKGMEMKQEQAIALGARLITAGSGAETAEAVAIKHSSDASILKVVVNNVNTAFIDVIGAVLDFENVADSKFTLKINDEFISNKLSGQELTALIASWMQGAISKPVLDAKLVAGGVIGSDVDLDKMNQQIADEPVSVSFNGGV